MAENESTGGVYLKDLIEEVLFKQYEKLEDIELGTEECLLASKAIGEQGKIWIEMNRVELEYNDREAQRESEKEIRYKQSNDQRNSAIAGLLITGLFGIGRTLTEGIIFSGLYDKGLKFEETGSLTTSTVKGLQKQFRLFRF